jgi:hypothetical protein
MFASPDGRKNLRILVHGRDELVVPADAAVYLTRLSRRRLVERGDATGLLARSVPEARVFSDDTARELTRFVINASLLSASDNVPPGRQ